MYKSIAGQRKIADWYDSQIRGAAFRSRMVATAFGDTHILEAGDEDNPALVLLPGTNFAALSWKDYLPALSAQFHVIAADTIGQPGKSAANRPPFKGSVYAEWLTAVLDALHIQRVSVIGHSLGGWLALKLAANAPERVDKVVLVDPAGLIGLRLTPTMMFKSTLFLIKPDEHSSGGMLGLMTTRPLHAATVEWMTLVGQHVKSSLAPPPIPTDELRQVKAKVLLISGERDIFLPPSKLSEKARQIFPDAQIVIVPDAGHLLPEEQPDIVLSHIRDFLQ